MIQSFIEYGRETFSGVFTNALFIAIIYGMVVFDLKRILGIDKIIDKIKNPVLKLLVLSTSYIMLILMGLIIVFFVVFLFWLLSIMI